MSKFPKPPRPRTHLDDVAHRDDQENVVEERGCALVAAGHVLVVVPLEKALRCGGRRRGAFDHLGVELLHLVEQVRVRRRVVTVICSSEGKSDADDGSKAGCTSWRQDRRNCSVSTYDSNLPSCLTEPMFGGKMDANRRPTAALTAGARVRMPVTSIFSWRLRTSRAAR